MRWKRAEMTGARALVFLAAGGWLFSGHGQAGEEERQAVPAFWTCARGDPANTRAVEANAEFRPPLKRMWVAPCHDTMRSPVVGVKTVVAHHRAADNKRTIHALDTDTGREKWTCQVEDYPVLSEDGRTVYVSSEGKLRALAIETGAEKWSNAAETGSLVCVSQGALYQQTGLLKRGNWKELVARKEENGQGLWRFQHEGDCPIPVLAAAGYTWSPTTACSTPWMPSPARRSGATTNWNSGPIAGA